MCHILPVNDMTCKRLLKCQGSTKKFFPLGNYESWRIPAGDLGCLDYVQNCDITNDSGATRVLASPHSVDVALALGHIEVSSSTKTVDIASELGMR